MVLLCGRVAVGTVKIRRLSRFAHASPVWVTVIAVMRVRPAGSFRPCSQTAPRNNTSPPPPPPAPGRHHGTFWLFQIPHVRDVTQGLSVRVGKGRTATAVSSCLSLRWYLNKVGGARGVSPAPTVSLFLGSTESGEHRAVCRRQANKKRRLRSEVLRLGGSLRWAGGHRPSRRLCLRPTSFPASARGRTREKRHNETIV